MMAVRQHYTGTIECGSLPDMVRIELPDMHLWLYPEGDRAVRVETEEKPAAEIGVRKMGAYDIWVDFNDIDDSGHTTTAADLIQPGHGPYGVGAAVVAGDGEGNRCPATVVEREVGGWKIVLRLDLDRFEGIEADHRLRYGPPEARAAISCDLHGHPDDCRPAKNRTRVP